MLHIPLKDDSKITCKFILVLIIGCSTIVGTLVGVGVFVAKNITGSNNEEPQESQEGFSNCLYL